MEIRINLTYLYPNLLAINAAAFGVNLSSHSIPMGALNLLFMGLGLYCTIDLFEKQRRLYIDEYSKLAAAYAECRALANEQARTMQEAAQEFEQLTHSITNQIKG